MLPESVERVAAVYDVHGNLPALEAVLREVTEWRPDLLLVGGDVLPGPMPAECLTLLDEVPLPVAWVRGNGDVDVVATARTGPPDRVPAAFHGVMRWVAGRTHERWLESISGWPLSVTLHVHGVGDVLFCHATPRDENEIFTANTPDEALREVFPQGDEEVVVCGHTHMPFDRLVERTRVVNAGSVGMPFGDTAAQWLTLGPEGVRPMRTTYDLDDARAESSRAGTRSRWTPVVHRTRKRCSRASIVPFGPSGVRGGRSRVHVRSRAVTEPSPVRDRPIVHPSEDQGLHNPDPSRSTRCPGIVSLWPR